MTDYHTPSKETEGQRKAWRTGALKSILALLIQDFGKEKVVEELEKMPEGNPFKF